MKHRVIGIFLAVILAGFAVGVDLARRHNVAPIVVIPKSDVSDSLSELEDTNKAIEEFVDPFEPELDDVPIEDIPVESDVEVIASPPLLDADDVEEVSFTITLPAITTVVPTVTALDPVTIPSESIVGLNCFYKHRPTGELFNTGRGSGVMIHPNGNILTARHVVDFLFSLTFSGGAQSSFDLANESDFHHCDVGVPPRTTSLPDADEIRRINPSTQLPLLAYTAGLAYTPPSFEGADFTEMSLMDFAVLEITGLAEDAQFFGITNVPDSFVFAEVAMNNSVQIGDEVLTYGFPGDRTTGNSASFNTLYLVGSVGHIDRIYSDGIIQTEMEISGGRSGSPLFRNGHVVGVVTSYLSGNRTISRSVGIDRMLNEIRPFLP